MAVALAALLMAQAGNAGRDYRGEVGTSQVRKLEQPGKLLDATIELPETVRQAIGFDGSTPESEVGVARAAADFVLAEAPWSRRLRFIGAAIAIGFDDRVSALTLLDEMPPPPNLQAARADDRPTPDVTITTKAAPSPEGLQRRLTDLAQGRAAPDWPSLQALLVAEQASPWLVERVRFRQLALVSSPEAPQALQASREAATAWVNLNLTHNLTLAGLFFVGFLLMISWPLLKRVVGRHRRRFNPLDLAPQFRLNALQGVLAWWFLGHIGMGVLVGIIAQPTQSWLVISMVLGSFLSGGIAVGLIQRRARRIGDLSPISLPLQLHLGSVTGGRWAIPLWAAGGLAVCIFFTAAGMVLHIMLVGAQGPTQSSVEALSNLTGSADIALAFVAVCIAAPLVEELIFRGFVYQTLRNATGPVLAMVISGFLFGLVHLDIAHLLPLSALGIGLAFIFEWSGSLWVPIIVHGLFNLLTALRIFTLSGT